MRELRNCDFSSNFVTEAAHCLGVAESKRHNAVTPFATIDSKEALLARVTLQRKATFLADVIE